MEQIAVSAEGQAEGVAEVRRVHHAEKESPLELFNSAEANALRAEIIRTGRKLWDRQYVDGNGGNISVRLGAEYLLCTPDHAEQGGPDARRTSACLTSTGKYLRATEP